MLTKFTAIIATVSESRPRNLRGESLTLRWHGWARWYVSVLLGGGGLITLRVTLSYACSQNASKIVNIAYLERYTLHLTLSLVNILARLRCVALLSSSPLPKRECEYKNVLKALRAAQNMPAGRMWPAGRRLRITVVFSNWLISSTDACSRCKSGLPSVGGLSLPAV